MMEKLRITMAFGLRLAVVLLLSAQGAVLAGDERQLWPREFHNADGSLTQILTKPQRILSTSVSITGTLLAIDAPVVASAMAFNGRYFGQWDTVAKARKVEKLWPAGSVDLEQVYAVAPDLIVVSINGGDSARAQLAELRQIAPTIVLDYGSQSWQNLARQLGEATGLEPQVNARIAEFDAVLVDCRSKMVIPAGLVNIISYNGPGVSNPIASRDGMYGQLLSSLGFTLEAPNPAWHSALTPPKDAIWAEYENLTQLSAPTTFLLNANAEQVAAFLHDPMLANLPSVRNQQVYSLGLNSFRIDYFSAKEIARDIARQFAPSQPLEQARQ